MRTILFFVLLLLIQSCTEEQSTTSYNLNDQPQPMEEPMSQKSRPKASYLLGVDTVLERNAANGLDLSKHQLFIDTTKYSVFHTNIKNWSPSQYANEDVTSSLLSINTSFTPQRLPPLNFPTYFITLRKFQGEFILYDRCDGIDQQFKLIDSAFIFYGPLESYAESIASICSISDQTIQLELRPYQSSPDKQMALLTIQKMRSFVYKLTYENQQRTRVIYTTTPAGVKHFDLMVNHCPTTKRQEYHGFDPVEK